MLFRVVVDGWVQEMPLPQAAALLAYAHLSGAKPEIKVVPKGSRMPRPMLPQEQAALVREATAVLS